MAESEAQQFAANFTVAQDSGATPSQQASYALSHAYDAVRAHEQYGGNRYLRVPDGQVQRAHFTYQRSTPHTYHRSQAGRRQSRDYGHRSSGGPSRGETVHGWYHTKDGIRQKGGFFAGLFGVLIDLFNR